MLYLVHVLYSTNIIKNLIHNLMFAGVELNQSSLEKGKKNKILLILYINNFAAI